MKINKISTYRVPIEYSSLDRYVEGDKYLPSALEVFSEDSINKVSWSIDNSTNASFTINTKQRPNYLKLESDLFTEDESLGDSYWFVSDVVEVESASAFRYECKLDVINTFGKNFLHTLKGKNINVKRRHEDRYLITRDSANNVVLEINTDNISLINSDFNVKDTQGQTKTYTQGKIINNESYISADIEYPQGGKGNAIIDNRVDRTGNKWYLYAVINILGTPNFYLEKPYNANYFNTNPLQQLTNYTQIGVGLDGLKLLAPITTNYPRGFIPPQARNNYANFYNTFLQLPQGKITSIFLSPIQLLKEDELNVGVHKMYFLTKQYQKNINDSIFISNYLSRLWDKESNSLNLLAYSYVPSASDDNLTLPTWNDELVRKRVFGPTSSWKDDVNNFLSSLTSEIGLFHPEISSMELIYKGYDEAISIDIYHFLKNSSVKINCYPDSQGLFMNINIADYNFAEFDSKTNLNVLTESGANYLNTNRAQIEAQKEGVRLHAHLQQNQIANKRTQNFGGGIIGGLMSALNPANYVSEVLYQREEKDMYNIADNNIDLINATISDASAKAPSIREGSGNSYKLTKTYELPYIFNYKYKAPNDRIRNLIYQHYNKFGYKVENWVIVEDKNEWYKTRIKFNFWQIGNVKDYYDGSLNLDQNIINQIENEFKLGVRIWHQQNIEYDNHNLEQTIFDFML